MNLYDDEPALLVPVARGKRLWFTINEIEYLLEGLDQKSRPKLKNWMDLIKYEKDCSSSSVCKALRVLYALHQDNRVVLENFICDAMEWYEFWYGDLE